MSVSVASTPQDGLESRRSLRDRLGDLTLRWISAIAAIGVIALIALIIYKVIASAWPAISKFGIGFLWNQTWNAVTDQFGALDFLVATLYVTGLAVLLAAPVALAIGLYLSELRLARRAASSARSSRCWPPSQASSWVSGGFSCSGRLSTTSSDRG